MRKLGKIANTELVGGFKHSDDFPFHIWDVIRNPLTNSTFIFFKMVKVKPPTSEVF
jgi:hypothetical protein